MKSPESIQTAFLLDHVLSVHAQTYAGDDEWGISHVRSDVVDQVVDFGSGVWKVTCQMSNESTHVIVVMSPEEDNVVAKLIHMIHVVNVQSKLKLYFLFRIFGACLHG